MGLSVNTFTYAGDDTFDLNFTLGYANQTDVTCYREDEPLIDLPFVWNTDSQVTLSSGHGLSNGDTVVFRRTVSKTLLPVDLTNPGEATREALEEALLHVVYITHELLDGRTADVHPWETVGDDTPFDVMYNYPYLNTYRAAKGEL